MSAFTQVALAELARSAIDPELAWANGWRESADGRAFEIPCPSATGGWASVRRVHKALRVEGEVKVRAPTGVSLGLLPGRQPPTDDAPVVIVEGIMQTGCVATWAPPEYAVYGISGADGVGKEHAPSVLAWLRDRRVWLWFDKDRHTKPGVAGAAKRWQRYLAVVGAAEVRLCDTPGPDGIDDVVPTWPEDRRTFGLATLLDAAPPVSTDLHTIDTEHEAQRERIRRAARRLVDAEERPAAVLPEGIDLATMLDAPEPETPWRVEGWLPAGSRVILAAQAKLGKTHMAHNLVRALADGVAFLDGPPVVPVEGTVAVLDFEMSQRQLRAWLARQRIEHTERVMVFPLRGAASAFGILDLEVCARWVKLLTAHRVDFLVWDCLRPVADALGLDEHHDMGALLTAFDELLAQAGIPEALIVHHMGHSAERSRGDSRLRDWPDVEWHLVGERTGRRHARAYGRDVDVPETGLTFDAETGRMSLVGGSRATAKIDAITEAVIEYVAEHPGASRTTIEEALDHPRRAVRVVLDGIAATGRVRTEDGPKRARLHFPVDHPASPPHPAITPPAGSHTTPPPPRKGAAGWRGRDGDENHHATSGVNGDVPHLIPVPPIDARRVAPACPKHVLLHVNAQCTCPRQEAS